MFFSGLPAKKRVLFAGRDRSARPSGRARGSLVVSRLASPYKLVVTAASLHSAEPLNFTIHPGPDLAPNRSITIINFSLPHHHPLPAERRLDALQPGPDLRVRLHDVVARRQTGHGPQDAVHGDVRQIH